MKRRLFLYFLCIGLLAGLLSSGCLVAVMAKQSEQQAFRQLSEEASIAEQGYEQYGEAWLASLQTDLRITHVSADGTVLYDNEADASQMGNHADRREIMEALQTGHGQTIHQSETLMERTLYEALRLPDGTVLRVACTQRSALSVLIGSLPMIAGILAIMGLLCILLAARLSSQLVKPINAVQLEAPQTDDVYPELAPLVNRIQNQNRTIREQMDQLMRSRNEFDAITGNMSEGFLLLSTHMEILSGNHAAFDLLQMHPDKKPLMLRKDCTVPRIVSAAESALAGIKDEEVLSFGEMSWQMIATPVCADGHLTGAVILLLDVTERVSRDLLRREFSANVSHELKTPLTSISGYAELMKEGMLPQEKTKQATETIWRESQRLIALIGDIINLSQLDEMDNRFETEEVDLYKLCEEVIDSLQMTAEKRNITVSLVGTQQTINGIPGVLQEMLYNLCDNAIKYNHPGGRVWVTVDAQQHHVRVTVKDNGIGIPYEHQQRVFERFYRVDKSRSRAIGGTGLGLSIVKHGVQLHHATLQLHSEPQHGTEITITF